MSHTHRFIRNALVALAFACVVTDVPAGPVNINTADASTLARELKGVGLKRAQAIVDYRAKHGPFKTADELTLVKGLGKQVVDKNRGEIRLDAVRSITKVQQVPVPAAASRPARKP